MSLVQTKSLLAKLMATENLHIEQRNVSTASFDVENRILTVPVLDNTVTSDQYDLFMGHEVGHALYTPLDGMKKAYDLKLSMSVMNVLEDSRIERKIKLKYPGIRQCFIRAYKQLIENDFFDTAGKDLNAMNFIDRVNLYCKAGIDTGIVFSDQEKVILDEIESTITYDDVIEVCKKVTDYMKSLNQPEPKFESSSPGYSDEDFDGPTEEVPASKGDGTEESKRESKDGAGNKEEETEETKSGGSSNDGGGKPDKEPNKTEKSGNSIGTGQGGVNSNKPIEEPVSHTDCAWRKNEDRLFSKKDVRYYYGNVPDYDLNKIIVGHKKLWDMYKKDVNDRQHMYGLNDTGINEKEFNKFREDSKKVVSYLVKEFEMKKNAQQMKRASVSKTGELNMSKIFSYKFSEDIFKRMTVVPDGKSHGLVMFIDWSGSMHNNMDNTIRQLLNLVMFCKKVNIPFEVYAFTQAFDHRQLYTQRAVAGDILLGSFNLMNLLSSQMTAVEYKYAASALLNFCSRYSNRPSWFSLSGTPLNEAIVAAMKIVPQFQKERKLQIVNTVFLTDGDGGKPSGIYTNTSYQSFRSNGAVVIRDYLTKHEVKIKDFTSREITSGFIKLLKARTNCNVIGFYILNNREFGNNIHNFYSDLDTPSKIESLKKEFRDEKYKIVTSEGYDEYYLLRAEGLDTEEGVEFTVKDNATTRGIVSAFTKYNNNRKTNRVVLNRFIGLIA